MDEAFEDRYNNKRLQQWEIPKYYPQRPRQRHGATRVISNERGHLLPGVPRPNSSAFSKFRSTYQLPDKLTRKFAKEYDDCLQQRHKYKSFEKAARTNCGKDSVNYYREEDFKGPCCPATCQTVQRVLAADRNQNKYIPQSGFEPADLTYVPGDFTPPAQQHDSRQLLLDQKSNDHPDLKIDSSTHGTGIDAVNKFRNLDDTDKPISSELRSDLKINATKIGDNKFSSINGTSYTAPLPLTASLTKPLVSPPLEYFPQYMGKETLDFDVKEPKMQHQRSITGKPGERCPSPIVPAYSNFVLAKRMHDENLDHQPLPDCVADLAYRKLQISGGQPGLALDIDPIATGVGIKTYAAGPTHCTKLKVFRPKTCGVVPKPLKGNEIFNAMNLSSSGQGKQMGAMDLAICWDYKPSNPADEPQPTKHIDGSNGSLGPAVFTYVKSPRDEAPNTGRSAGVFQNTLGETDFFDKDIMRRKTDFAGRSIEPDSYCAGISDPPITRARSVTRDFRRSEMPNRLGKQYQSTPNVVSETDYKALRSKYLNDTEACPKSMLGPSCRRLLPGLFQRARTRLCHKVAPQPPSCCHIPERRPHCKAAFRVGVPKYDAAGFFISSDSGCSTGSHCHGNRVLVVPRPRIPYMKKNYDIETLVPPFTSINGGASEGGYPEHWRLASVYQHSFKAPGLRRRPLLETVYK